MTPSELSAAECAHVAMRSLLGSRGPELLTALTSPSTAAVALHRALSHPERSVRSAALAAELGRVVRGLEALELARWAAEPRP